jgi:hypothetical protein
VKPVSEPSYRSASTLAGAGGTYVFRFAAIAPRQTMLTRISHRSFERDVPLRKTISARSSCAAG